MKTYNVISPHGVVSFDAVSDAVADFITIFAGNGWWYCSADDRSYDGRTFARADDVESHLLDVHAIESVDDFLAANLDAIVAACATVSGEGIAAYQITHFVRTLP